LQLRRANDTASRWNEYKDGYERLLRPEAEAVPEAPEEGFRRQIWNPPKPIATGAVAAPAATTDEEERR
jgi:hypothetical protein